MGGEKGIKKANNNSTLKNTIVQCIFPAIVFFVVVFFMIYTFVIKQQDIILREIDNKIQATATVYATKVYTHLNTLQKVGKPFQKILSRDEFSSQVVKIMSLESIADNSEAHTVLYVNSQGKGYTQDGDPIDLGTESYIGELSMDESEIFYQQEDLVSSTPSFVVSLPVQKDDSFILMYYKADVIDSYTNIREYDGKTWSVLVNKEGEILFSSGSKASYLAEGKNLMDSLAVYTSRETLLEKIKKQMEFTQAAKLVTELPEGEVYLSFVPLGVNDWYYVMGISNSYVNTMINSKWGPTRTVARNMVISLGVFLGFLVSINLAYHNTFTTKSIDLQKKADTDLLTELNNKIATERKIREYIEENAGQQCLLFVFDIDNFKKINDTRGHAFGDEVLRNIGMRLKAEFRVSDIIGRVGGDEFILFLKNIKDEDVLQKESHRVANVFHDFKVGQYSKYSITSSIGCAVYPSDGEDFKTLYKAADKGLYKAKQRGKNQLAFCDDARQK